MLQCVIAVEQCPVKLLPAWGSCHSVQLWSCPVSATSLIVDGNNCAAKSWRGAGWSLPGTSPSMCWPMKLLFCPWGELAALPCGAMPAQDRVCHRHGCSRLGGAGPSWELTAGDSRQPILLWELILLWVTPTAPVQGQLHWRLHPYRWGIVIFPPINQPALIWA